MLKLLFAVYSHKEEKPIFPLVVSTWDTWKTLEHSFYTLRTGHNNTLSLEWSNSLHKTVLNGQNYPLSLEEYDENVLWYPIVLLLSFKIILENIFELILSRTFYKDKAWGQHFSSPFISKLNVLWSAQHKKLHFHAKYKHFFGILWLPYTFWYRKHVFLLENVKNNLKCQLDDHTGDSYLCHFDISVCSVSSGRPKYNVAIGISPFLSLQHVQDWVFFWTQKESKKL